MTFVSPQHPSCYREVVCTHECESQIATSVVVPQMPSALLFETGSLIGLEFIKYSKLTGK